jgi:hypothetical protein
MTTRFLTTSNQAEPRQKERKRKESGNLPETFGIPFSHAAIHHFSIMASRFEPTSHQAEVAEKRKKAKKRRILANLSDTIFARRNLTFWHDEKDNSKRRIRSAATVPNKTLSEEPVLREVGGQTRGNRFNRSASSLVRRLSDCKNRTGFL